MVRAVDHDVAIRATSPQNLLSRYLSGVVRVRKVIAAIQGTRVVSLGMALLAQEWLSYLQHPRVYCTVRIVAIYAAFPCRLVLDQERSPLFSMALVAGLDDCILFQVCGTG